ncbi:MAG TPA: hypothetical protein VGY54_16925, partial [Polyangiaceae bacterium]|nr:hypothetical protein [Polyangiaceae bacterium]
MTKKKKKQPKPEPKWRMVERVAALIEKIIDPTATVEHDVRLPDLETPGHKRQCDVVVTTGPQHRRTRTIVEVQKRDHKVKVLDFDGWIAKMRAVGAQHLICVSAAGYPASVIARAAKHGPTVRLATLRELREKSHLLDGALGRILFVHQKPTRLVHAELLGDRAAVEALSAQTLTPDSETPAFRLDDGTILSMGQIVMRMTAHYEPLNRAQSGEHTIMVETRERLTFLLSDPPVRTRLR